MKNPVFIDRIRSKSSGKNKGFHFEIEVDLDQLEGVDHGMFLANLGNELVDNIKGNWKEGKRADKQGHKKQLSKNTIKDRRTDYALQSKQQAKEIADHFPKLAFIYWYRLYSRNKKSVAYNEKRNDYWFDRLKRAKRNYKTRKITGKALKGYKYKDLYSGIKYKPEIYNIQHLNSSGLMIASLRSYVMKPRRYRTRNGRIIKINGGLKLVVDQKRAKTAMYAGGFRNINMGKKINELSSSKQLLRNYFYWKHARSTFRLLKILYKISKTAIKIAGV